MILWTAAVKMLNRAHVAFFLEKKRKNMALHEPHALKQSNIKLILVGNCLDELKLSANFGTYEHEPEGGVMWPNLYPLY